MFNLEDNQDKHHVAVAVVAAVSLMALESRTILLEHQFTAPSESAIMGRRLGRSPSDAPAIPFVLHPRPLSCR